MGPVMSQAALPPSAAVRAVLDPFFRSFGFDSDDELEKLSCWALGDAPSHEVTALELARARTELWLSQVLGLTADTGVLLALGRAAFVLSGAAAHGAALLATPVHALEPQLVASLRAALPLPFPPPLPGAMPAQQLVLNPLTELLRRCWRASEPDMSLSR